VTASLRLLRWALGAGVLHQRLVVELLGLAQHRTRDRDLVVEGELADDAGRRVADRRESVRQLGAGHRLDLVCETANHVAECRNLVLAIAPRDQKIRGVPQRAGAALGGSARNRVVQVLQHRSGFAHDGKCHSSQ
jgi:hypothetical protein